MFQSNAEKRNLSEAFIFKFCINKPNQKARYLQFTLAHSVRNSLFSLKYYTPLLHSETVADKLAKKSGIKIRLTFQLEDCN